MSEKVIRGTINRILHLMARFLPGSTTMRPFLHRLRGVKIHGKVFIGEDVYLENSYPECIEIHDDVQITLKTNMIVHSRGGVGKIIIQNNAYIGMASNIAASPGQTLTIGEGAAIAMGSNVTKDVPPFTLVAGSPVKPIYRVTVPMSLNTDFTDWKKGLRPL